MRGGRVWFVEVGGEVETCWRQVSQQHAAASHLPLSTINPPFSAPKRKPPPGPGRGEPAAAGGGGEPQGRRQHAHKRLRAVGERLGPRPRRRLRLVCSRCRPRTCVTTLLLPQPAHLPDLSFTMNSTSTTHKTSLSKPTNQPSNQPTNQPTRPSRTASRATRASRAAAAPAAPTAPAQTRPRSAAA